jgi:hypothetical protein
VYNKRRSETLFFDWLLVDIESVIQILEHYTSFESFFSHTTIVNRDTTITGAGVRFTSVPKCEFLHDLTSKYTSDMVSKFIEKYTRRYNRILAHIRSDVHLYFLYKGDMTFSERVRFINIIKTINPQCNFTLAHIIKAPCPTSLEPNFIQISAELYKKPESENEVIDWTEKNYDWSACLGDIISRTRQNTT